jgi:tetratricopeptide (TPR) repeat protein
VTELDYKRKAAELLQKGRYDDAIAQYRQLIATSKKKNPAILNLIGDIHVKQAAPDAAFESYLEASRLYAEESLFHNAIAVGKKILRLDREQTEVYGILGNLYARQGLGMDSIKFLQEYARRKEERDEYAAALAAFAEGCDILEDSPEIRIAYGAMLEKVGRHEDAATCYRKASEIFASKGQRAAAETWARRAGQEGAPDAGEENEVQDMADLMSLRTLDDDAPRPPSRAAIPAPETEAQEPAWGTSGPLDLDDDVDKQPRAPWAAFDPRRNPDIPPPPPLPGRGPAAAPPPAPEEPRQPAVAAGHNLVDLQLELPDEAPAASAPAPPAPPAAPRGAPPRKAETEDVELDLRDLPGIILPGGRGGSAPAPPAPGAPAPGAPAPSEADLATFFGAAAPGESDEQAVVIGDDFELLREGGSVSEVIADFRAATMEILDLDDFQAHYDLGTTYMEMELFEESAAEFEIAARGERWALASREMLGYCFLRQGQIDAAIRELRKGLELPGEERDKLGLLYNLGIACGVLDNEQAAIAAFQRILEVDPNFRDTRLRLERLVQSAG